ncbi:translationally-controlled tumor protein, partial [Lysobacter sp. 13A]|uniref:translationally-controlled tumor protein n=1 Tax=Novilysobacter selenitireducens TaxID=2872639 RepID=UPI001CBC4E39
MLQAGRECADTVIGANPSAEEAGEALEDGASSVNNVVHSFRLQPTSFDKKTYLGYLKVRKSVAQLDTALIHSLGIHEVDQRQAPGGSGRG